MKSIISASLFIFVSLSVAQSSAQSSFAAFVSATCTQGTPVVMACKRGEFLTNVGCSRASSVRCTSAFTAAENKAFVIGKLKDVLIGELDPFILGDGSLGLIESHVDVSKNFLIYLPAQDPNYLAQQQYMSDQGVIIGIPRSALTRPTTEERAEMLDLAKRHLGLNSDAGTYKFSSVP